MARRRRAASAQDLLGRSRARVAARPTELDVAAEDLRLPFASLALISTDGAALSFAELAIARLYRRLVHELAGNGVEHGSRITGAQRVKVIFCRRVVLDLESQVWTPSPGRRLPSPGRTVGKSQLDSRSKQSDPLYSWTSTISAWARHLKGRPALPRLRRFVPHRRRGAPRLRRSAPEEALRA